MERKVVYLSVLILVTVIAGAAVFSLPTPAPVVQHNVTGNVQVPSILTTLISSKITNSTNRTAQNASEMIPNGTGFGLCPYSTITPTWTKILNSSGFVVSDIRGPQHAYTNGTNSNLWPDYIILPGHNATITYENYWGWPYLVGKATNASFRNLAIDNWVAVENLNSNLKDSGINISISPQNERYTANSIYIVTARFKIASNSIKGTSWIELSPGVCTNAAPFLFTIGNTAYSGEIGAAP